MTATDTRHDNLAGTLDRPTHELVRAAIAIAVAREGDLRVAMIRVARSDVDPRWIEELILQSYLFVGLPRTLNAAREWRKASGRPAPAHDEGVEFDNVAQWEERGRETCAAVYGDSYDRLRTNIQGLHPALDAWMIVEGYGKVLGRAGLDLRRRELCIVGVCAATGQERQLHAHLRGALNVGAHPAQIDEVLSLAAERLDAESVRRYTHLWMRVRGDS
ncbi:MAG TPA: carboxymuconolactone decarboxylase family protein [Gemmatimonadaceae bacterium]